MCQVCNAEVNQINSQAALALSQTLVNLYSINSPSSVIKAVEDRLLNLVQLPKAKEEEPQASDKTTGEAEAQSESVELPPELKALTDMLEALGVSFKVRRL
jgi:hypothetical protein